MRRTIAVALAAWSVCAFALLALASEAEARRGGSGSGFRGCDGGSARAAAALRSAPVIRNAPRVHQATIVRRSFHPRVTSAPIYVTSYGTGCAWLRHRAIESGRSYWWQRYRRCMGRS